MTAAIGPRASGAAEHPSAALRTSPIGTVPILWNNADLPALAPRIDADVVLDEISRLGFIGTQTGLGFPEGAMWRLDRAAA